MQTSELHSRFPRRQPVVLGGYALNILKQRILIFFLPKAKKLGETKKQIHSFMKPLQGSVGNAIFSGLAGCQPTSARIAPPNKPQGPAPVLYGPQSVDKWPSNPIRQQQRLSKEIKQTETGKGKVTGNKLCLKQSISSLLL